MADKTLTKEEREKMAKECRECPVRNRRTAQYAANYKDKV